MYSLVKEYILLNMMFLYYLLMHVSVAHFYQLYNILFKYMPIFLYHSLGHNFWVICFIFLRNNNTIKVFKYYFSKYTNTRVILIFIPRSRILEPLGRYFHIYCFKYVLISFHSVNGIFILTKSE